VTGPDDRETPPKSSTPPDSQAWLPPRLRDKLDNPEGGGDDDLDFLKKKSSPVGMIIGIVVVVALAGGGWWFIHNNQLKEKAAAEKAAADARAAAVADSLAAVRQADSLAAVARADSIAFTKLPRAEQRRILALRAKNAAGASGAAPAAGAGASAGAAATPAPAGGTASTEPAAPKEKGPFAIDAGQYLDEEKANQVAETLKGTTGLPARAVSIDGTFHVLVGSFSSRATAEARGSSLLGKGLIEQAAVVAVPK
jgi:hypothetical protein